MPPEFRLYLVAAFVKFVSYDFGCNVCQFVFQSPTTREAARAGLVYGPVAAVSARPTVDYTMPSPETAQALDLAREVVAALITSQHRAREGKSESRFGEGRWWTTKPRWGGGTGGPIGREIEKDALQGDKDAKLDEDQRGALRRLAKKSRKTMSIYDNYRMVRPPALTWDQKARYETIGTRKGAGFDDIFVVSSLFHHISIMRVRIPKRLLDVLDGAPDPDVSQRSWGKVSAWRSPWHDLFDTRERLAALRLLWAMMAYQMRAEQANGDVKMDDA
ncbi:hypothetical protein ESCO_002608 [Escovopsis weberi]|uniref:Uncharacterized protein n=1 Tax=Escovopsis weberi TaxID=150374 RepID=A0A0M8MR12_ESCWE|nr:hypothetical protein ESCO_002608 [Escovopsis weberi]